MLLNENDFLRSSTRDLWELKKPKREELGFMLYVIAVRKPLHQVLTRVSGLLDSLTANWEAVARDCAELVLADLQNNVSFSSLEEVAASLRLKDLTVAASPKMPLQIEAYFASEVLPERAIIAMLSEAAEILGVQVGRER